MDKIAQLQWQIAMGADEALEDAPVNRLAVVFTRPEPQAEIPPEPVQAHSLQGFSEPAAPAMVREPIIAREPVASIAPTEAMAKARELADNATTLDELRAAVTRFEGLAICKTATNTVFADGVPDSDIMFIGEAPGANEDAEGIPFCGQAGQLMDELVKWIGLDRKKNVYISNTLFWRPPGNRRPTPEELAVCRPFVEKHIALINPKLLVLWGGTATSALLETTTGITKLRGSFHSYTNRYLKSPVDTLAVFHPSYLLRQPGQKREMWHDLLKMKGYIAEKALRV